MKKLIVASATLAIASLSIAWAQEKGTIVFANAGGELSVTMDQVFIQPFTAETGIAVKQVASDNFLGKIKAMQAAGNIEWDISEMGPEEQAIAIKNGWLEKLDWTKLDPKNEMPPEARNEYGFAYGVYSNVLAVRTDKLPEGRQMTGWADFWDVEAFPGPRALANTPQHNLEFALLADGVPKEQVYEVLSTEGGIDRAFAKLDEIKPHITKWWSAGAEPVQMLANGEVYYATGYNGRLTKMATEGHPVEVIWNGGDLVNQYLTILKGAKNVEQSYEFLAKTFLDPKRMAEWTNIIFYPSADPRIYEYLPEELGSKLPTFPANASQQLQFDAGWWTDRLDVIQKRWNTWILE